MVWPQYERAMDVLLVPYIVVRMRALYPFMTKEFDKADKDKSGKVTFAEFKKYFVRLIRKSDKDGDNNLSDEEIEKYLQRSARFKEGIMVLRALFDGAHKSKAHGLN